MLQAFPEAEPTSAPRTTSELSAITGTTAKFARVGDISPSVRIIPAITVMAEKVSGARGLDRWALREHVQPAGSARAAVLHPEQLSRRLGAERFGDPPVCSKGDRLPPGAKAWAKGLPDECFDRALRYEHIGCTCHFRHRGCVVVAFIAEGKRRGGWL